jgi:phenylacetate-CoA ligase
MLETVYAQIRFAMSALFARPFHLPSLNRLVEALLATYYEFGELTHEAGELMIGPVLDEDARRELQLRRFRRQAVRATRETRYYAVLFEALGLDPRQLTEETIRRLPLTTKATLRTQAPAFVCRSQQPTLLTTTTGTTGRPLSMYFTAREMDIFAALAAIGFLLRGEITPADVVQVSTSARASLANTAFINACQRVKSLVYQTGLIDPTQTLALLTERRPIPGKKARPSVLLTYPSYLGKLVTDGLSQGYTPADFGLERIFLGGEIVTEGVKQHCQALFGPVKIEEAYGITEAYPLGGVICEQGQLHYEPLNGLMEVIDPDTGRPAQPGQIGSLILTPFAPYREAMVVLRYDSQDLVRSPARPCACSLKHLPAVGKLLGKKRLAVRHAHGWTTPADVLEAIAAVEAIPMPARGGLWPLADGVAVEVAVPHDHPALRHRLEASLQAWGVPVRTLVLVTNPADLSQPIPLRGDLTETGFEPPAGSVLPLTTLRPANLAVPALSGE